MDSTAEYVANSFKGREQAARKMLEAYRGELSDRKSEKVAEKYGELDDMPLSVEVKRVIEVTLGVGGPSDWIEAELDSDGDVTSATYYAVWGGERRETRLNSDDALWQVAEHFAEGIGE
jgi:hypothetical protein